MTRKKGLNKGGGGGGKGHQGVEDTSSIPSPGPSTSADTDDTETEVHPEDEYIVPQIVKVVSLSTVASSSNYSLNVGGGGRGVRSSNNIVLVDNGDDGNADDPANPPPSFIDNGHAHNHQHLGHNEEPENILGLAYGDEEEDEEVDEDDDGDEFNHKFASFSLSTPCQPDDKIDYFSCRGSRGGSGGSGGGGFQQFTLANPSNNSSRGYNDTSSTKSNSSSSHRLPPHGGDEMNEDEEFENVFWAKAVPCTTIWEELRFCEAKEANCTTPANKKCSQCKNAFYCSEEHHRMDWSRHRLYCTSYRIQFVGMGAADDQPVSAAVACRNIPAGQVIFSEKPMLVFPLADSESENQLKSPIDLACILARMKGGGGNSPHFNSAEVPCSETNRPSCLGCTKPWGLLAWGRENRCSKCALPLCSYNCQILIAHQAGECDAISSSNFEVTENSWLHCVHALYMDVEIMRALQLEKYDRGVWELLLEMRNYVRVEHYKKTDRFHLFVKNMELLVPVSVKISGYNLDLIADVHAIINSLSFRPNLNCPFKLLFNTQPQFAHDCVPNTLQYIEDEHLGDGKRMKLVTKSAVPIMKGNVISLDFTPSPYLSYQRRRTVLSDVLNIANCLCQRCQHPSVMNDLTAEIKCYNCRTGTVFSENFPLWKESVWSCRICQEEISFYRIQEIERDAGTELSLMLASAENTGLVREVQDWIRRKGRLDLNPKHHLIFTAWCYCESLVRDRVARARRPDPAHVYTVEEMEHFELLGRFADVALEHMDSIRPGIWVDKGITQFHKFYSSFVQVCSSYQRRTLSPKEFVNNVMKSLKILQSALQTLSVYEGYNGPSVLHLTHEATSVLSSLKEYMAYFLQLSDHNSYPLPPLAQVLNRAHV